jgi:O-antigen ligase
MQLEIRNFAMCFGNLFVLCVLLQLQDSESATRAAKWFSVGLIASSTYAIVLRNTWQIRAVRGPESEAIWGSGIMRFMGLIPDPNYYMVMVIIALALLIKLKDSGRLRTLHFWIMGIILSLFGALSYSKTFLLVYVLLGGIYIIWQFWNKKIFSAMFLSIAAVAAASFLLFSDASPVKVIVDRLLGAKSLSDLTTGRTDIYVAYWKAITSDAATFLFGRGIAADRLIDDPHNIYLEITYHTGLIGLLLFAGFYLSMVWVLNCQVPEVRTQRRIAKYIVLLMVLILYISLNGMFQIDFYGDFFVAFLSLLITKKQSDLDPMKRTVSD